MSHSFCPDCLLAEKTALRLITRAEQCVQGLSQKLVKRGYNKDCAAVVISRLCEQNLINDSRFAQFWLESRLRLTRTPRRLLISLCTRGIDRETAGNAIKAVFNEETEFDMLVRFMKKKSRKAKKSEDTRSLNYLLKTEGFSAQVIQRYFE